MNRTTWQPVMSVMQLQPGAVLRYRDAKHEVRTVIQQRRNLINFDDGTCTTVKAAKRYLEFQTAAR